MTDIYSHLDTRTLDNGLRVWCLPRPQSGTVAMLAHVPVGARNETEENNGISHFLEHMLFTGSKRWDEAQIAEEVRQRGGYYNARTAREDTMFYLHIDASYLGFGMEWLHEVVFNPAFNADKLEKERQVIINEKGGEYDRIQRVWEWVEDRNFGWSVTRAVRNRLYPKSTMMLSVIGKDKSLKNINHDTMVEYYQRHYVPQNTTIIVVGDIDPEQAFEMAEQHFGTAPKALAPAQPKPLPINHKMFNIKLKGPMPNDQSQYMIGSLIDHGNHQDRFAWWLVEELIDDATMREIRFKLGLTYGVNTFSNLYLDTGYFGVYVRSKSEDMDIIKRTLEEQLDRIANGEVTSNELEKAKTAVRGRNLLELQDNMEMAIWLAFDALHTTDNEVDDYFASIDAVTLEDIHRVGREYFASEHRFRVEHTPALTPKSARPVAIGILGAATAILAFGRRKN